MNLKSVCLFALLFGYTYAVPLKEEKDSEESHRNTTSTTTTTAKPKFPNGPVVRREATGLLEDAKKRLPQNKFTDGKTEDMSGGVVMKNSQGKVYKVIRRRVTDKPAPAPAKNDTAIPAKEGQGEKETKLEELSKKADQDAEENEDEIEDEGEGEDEGDKEGEEESEEDEQDKESESNNEGDEETNTKDTDAFKTSGETKKSDDDETKRGVTADESNKGIQARRRRSHYDTRFSSYSAPAIRSVLIENEGSSARSSLSALRSNRYRRTVGSNGSPARSSGPCCDPTADDH